MSILTAAPALLQPLVIVAAETVRGGEVVTAEHRVSWLGRPTFHNTGWTGAILRIDGQIYAAESLFTTDDDTGHIWQIVDLRTFGRKHYRLTIGPDSIACDCPHMTYRGVTCKHSAAVEEALLQLERIERAEWRAAVAAQDLADLAIAPF